MVSRREVIGGLVGAAVAPKATASPAAAAPPGGATAQAVEREVAERIANALMAIRAELEKHRTTDDTGQSDAVIALRRAMYTHVRANRRFPAYIEVGWGIWMDVYDWHVGTRQPLAASQLPDGRYTLRLMQTTLILRPDMDDRHISPPFDELVGDVAPTGAP